jgi:hypothetical protein
VSNLSKMLRPRLAELGKIKVGGKGAERTSSKGTKYRVPVKWDHFVITTLERDAAGDLKPDTQLMERLLHKYGVEVDEAQPGGGTKKVKRLREIPIAVLSDDLDQLIQASYCWYSGRKLAAVCDGENCTWYQRKGQVLPVPETVPCDGEHTVKDGKGNSIFKLHAKFGCVIADGEARWGGLYFLRSTSVITAEQLYGTLQHIQRLTGGILQGLPLRMVVRTVEVNPTVDGVQTSSKVPVIHIELRGQDLNQIQQLALQQAQLRIKNERELSATAQEYVKLLKAPGQDEPEEEQADVAEEFAPGPENARTENGQEKKAAEQTVEVAAVVEATTPAGNKVRVVDEPAVEGAKPASEPPAKAKAKSAAEPPAKSAAENGNGKAPPADLADLPF